MQESDSLSKIHTLLVNRAVMSLARGSGQREELRDQIERFYTALEQAVDAGDPAWLDPLLSTWMASQTQAALEGGPPILLPLLRELMNISSTTFREVLTEREALDLSIAMVPCFAYAFEKMTEGEIASRVDHITNQYLQAQERLKRLDRSKSDFVAVAAHELKTPLTLVAGYASMLKDNLKPGPESIESMLIDGIESGTKRLKTIIDDMIDVSLIDNKLLTVNFQPVWLNQILESLNHELGASLIQRKIEFEIIKFPGFEEMIFGDPDRLMQVFRNLLINAIKFTPDGGKITIDGRKLPGMLEVIVADTGIGIDLEMQVSIFDKFSRLGDTATHSSGKTKFKGGGPGLGLFITKGILEAHGGSIWVESPGFDEKTFPGSKFHVLIPTLNEPSDMKVKQLFVNQVESLHD